MSLWEWTAVCAGHARANAPREGLSQAEKDQLWLFVNDNDPQPRTLSTTIYAWDGRVLLPRGIVTFMSGG